MMMHKRPGAYSPPRYNALLDLTPLSLLFEYLSTAALTKARMEEIEREFQATIAEIQAELEKIQVYRRSVNVVAAIDVLLPLDGFCFC